MARVTVRREVELPNPRLLARLERCPELGPRALFFSGGSALRETSRHIIAATHNSAHLITPFDSGGSSAELRRAFHMPAVGDIRSRLMALADTSLCGNPEVFALFAHRLPKAEPQNALRRELARMTAGRHPLVARIPDPLRKIIRNHLYAFAEAMPEDFDLSGASIGNLVLTGGYLGNRRHLDPVIFIFSHLVAVRGIVRPVVNSDLSLAAELADGKVVVGQHRLTGKEIPPLTQRIDRLFLVADAETAEPAHPALREKTAALIRAAELICYPMGSFFTSLMACLLPGGVGSAVTEARCPKLYVPSTGVDPECVGLSVADQVERLLVQLAADAPDRIRPADVLQYVLVDSRRGEYPGGLDIPRIRKMGIEVIDCPLVGDGPSRDIDARLLVPILLSLA